MKKYYIIIPALIAVFVAVGFVLKPKVIEKAFEPNGNEDTPTGQLPSNNTAPEIVQQNLTVPWEIVFLPNGDMLITERSGNLKRFGSATATIAINGVSQRGEGGLLGFALHPKFSENQLIYVYFTTANGTNKIERYALGANALNDRMTIIENIPGASNHDGGRIAFGPDNKLYATTGDAQQESNAQNTNSLAGKILRLNDDGSIPSDNPFNNAVYSYGHRNPQGLAWDSSGNLWSTEHGRSGIRSGFDELNLIQKGKNYGWPTIEGDAAAGNMEKPKAHSGASTTWAPADMVIIGDTIYFTGLRGQSLYEAKIDGTVIKEVKPNYTSAYGRLRSLTYHDGYLYFGTSNKDGRGSPKTGDDTILKIKIE